MCRCRSPDYFGVPPLFVPSYTDCVVVDLSIFDLLGRPHEAKCQDCERNL
jgi:hypothetical protein